MPSPSPRSPLLRLLAMVFAALLLPAPAFAACTLGEPGVTQAVTLKPEMAVTLHAPTATGRGAPLPLVILLHGSGGTGSAMLRDSKLAGTADRNGFLVAAPDAGIGHEQGYVWNIPGVPTVSGALPGPKDRDDTAYLLAMVDALAAAGCVDPTRVYVTGLSGGGRMTSWLACAAADRIAAIAPVVGLRAGRPRRDAPTTPDPATCRPAMPMPVLAFAGDKDTTNPVEGGGAGYWQYTMHAAEQRWAQLNGCTEAPVSRWVAEGVYEERYAGCREGASVTGRIAVGGGHSWDVVDNEALWAFVSQHQRPAVARR